MPIFDSYLMVDWSAAIRPAQGRDSIWLGLTEQRRNGYILAQLENPSTRNEATDRIIEMALKGLRLGRRMLIGFDFPLGFPNGTAKRLGFKGLPWRNLWQTLEDRVVDCEDNQNNRFDVAETLNAELTGEAFPFWGLPREEERTHLVRRGRRPHGPQDLAERRLCDIRVPSAQPIWKLAGAGSVGGQALTGIPRIWQIRKSPELAFQSQIWPFETGLSIDSTGAIIIAEIYPSLVPPRRLDGRPKDAEQVAAIGGAYAELDLKGSLASLFQGDTELPEKLRHSVETEEAWILGITHGNVLAAT